MIVSIDLISGINLGIEYVEDTGYGKGILIDLFIFRILLEWE